jgi:hypothetical protein
MYLEVTAAGGKYWRMKYRHAGKEKRLARGVYPTRHRQAGNCSHEDAYASIVPLGPQAVEILQARQTLSNGRSLLFPGERDHAHPMSNNTILAAPKRMGYAARMTGLGFRDTRNTLFV